tara:strand:- start:668 stop:1126 length:459 start_codon:yes stop_codon:yes gene_type:complete
MIRVLKWISGLVIFGLMSFWVLGVYVFDSQGTDVAYQTSDGFWADNEVLFKGRNFAGIVFGYELYKIVCETSDVELQRITDKPSIFKASWWFDDFNSPKWKVPLVERHPNLNGKNYYRPKDTQHCSNRAVSQAELDLARERAERYINALQNS